MKNIFKKLEAEIASIGNDGVMNRKKFAENVAKDVVKFMVHTMILCFVAGIALTSIIYTIWLNKLD